MGYGIRSDIMNIANKNFNVAVVIPIYNAAKYIEKAVESVVHEPEVKEVILIDDGYPDHSVQVCRQLSQKYKRIRFFQHPHGENRGAGASCNLGIKMATAEYIAFLDADDHYLPGRFSTTAELFSRQPEVDAIYEPVGTVFADEEARRDFCKWRKISWEESADYITYPIQPLSGKELFYSFLRGDNGFPHINGITVRKSLFDKVGLFNARLRLHQDAEWWIRAAYTGNFVPGGHSKPVAMRLAHSENRIKDRNYESMYRFHESVYNWSIQDSVDPLAARIILKNYIISKCWRRYGDNLLTKLLWRLSYYGVLLTNPRYWPA